MALLQSNPDLQADAVPPQVMQGMMVGIVGIVFVLSLVGLLLGYGLLKVQLWAWLITLASQAYELGAGVQGLLTLASYGTLQATTLLQNHLALRLSAVIIYYLLRPTVRQAFHPPRQ